MAFQTSSPAAVRAFAKENGLPVGSRGRFQPSLIEAFNKAHKTARYDTAAHVPKVAHTVVGPKGGKTTRKVNLTEVRVAALAKGHTIGSRGRIPTSVLDAYVTGTL